MLKVTHTFNVRGNTNLIAEEQSLNHNSVLLAGTSALFHDLGRFQQYARYKTFKDSVSVNHGKLGAEILETKGLLKCLPEKEQELILNTVRFHNAFSIPETQDSKKILFLKLIRDADKLDIWRVFTEQFEGSGNEPASAAGLGLPDTEGCSEEAVSHLRNKQIAVLSSLKNLNDLKLMLISWTFDLNFKTSFRLLSERDYINRIASTLPQTDKIISALAVAREFANRKIHA